MGKKKSEDFNMLLKHMAWIFVSFIFLGQFAVDDDLSLIRFTFAYTLLHGIQDWFMWRSYKWTVKYRLKKEWGKHLYKFLTIEPETWFDRKVKTYKYWEDSKFYDTIGLDQLLHFITITLLVEWLC
jgi:hypothetical protein